MSAEGKKFCPQAATDVELLNEIAQNGCDHAVEELISRYTALVRSVVGGVLKGQCPIEDREDVEQEVWLRISQYRRSFDASPGSTVAALIWRITKNAALSHVWKCGRQRIREERSDENKLDLLTGPKSATQWLHNYYDEQSFIVFDLIDRTLSQLNDEHLRLVTAIMDPQNEDMTYKDFAEQFGTSESNVKIIMHRFKERYVKLLEEYRKGNER
jgi:RNA polymerase sigma factor (sigma-70 family)